MSILLTSSLKQLLKQTASQLKGAAKRKFIASTVQGLGLGGQRLAESEMYIRVCSELLLEYTFSLLSSLP